MSDYYGALRLLFDDEAAAIHLAQECRQKDAAIAQLLQERHAAVQELATVRRAIEASKRATN